MWFVVFFFQEVPDQHILPEISPQNVPVALKLNIVYIELFNPPFSNTVIYLMSEFLEMVASFARLLKPEIRECVSFLLLSLYSIIQGFLNARSL